MGCCKSDQDKLSKEAIISNLIKAVKENNIAKFKYLLKLKIPGTVETVDINYNIFKLNEKISVNFPCLCILEGKLELFKYIHQSYTLVVQIIENIFTDYKLSALSILCVKGFDEFLSYYLPLALSVNVKVNEFSDSVEICFSGEETLREHPVGYSPIQLACFFGNINCVKVVNSYFKNSKPPIWLDIHYQDPQSGYNCALVSCKSGNYSMIKYLFSNNCNFNLLNNRNESALQIFLITCKHQKICDKLSIVKYLIEVIKVNLLYEYEETLLICEFPELLNYIQQKLADLGVDAKKSDIEASNDIRFSGKTDEVSLTQNMFDSKFLDD